MSTATIIGIGGGSGSGKTTIVNKISEIVTDFVLIAVWATPEGGFNDQAMQVLISFIRHIT